MKLLFAYFSATGNTKKIADTMVKRFKEIGSKVEKLDITLPEARQPGMDLFFDAAFRVAHTFHASAAIGAGMAGQSRWGRYEVRHLFHLWGLPGSPHSLRHPGEASPSWFYGGGFG